MLERLATRRNFPVRLSVLITGLFSWNARATALKEIPSAKSLQVEISLALKTASPLLVFISLDHCPFCKIARENYLVPLMNEQSISIVQVNFGHLTSVTDTRGFALAQDQLIRAWGVKVAPTVLFLGRDGKEVAPRLVGGSTSDFYGAYLDERLRLARNEIVRDQTGSK
jgi:thioredoxin-related protein